MLRTYKIKTKIVVTNSANGKTYEKEFSTVALYHWATQGRPMSFEIKGENILDFLYQDDEVGKKLKRTIGVKTRKYWKNKGRREVHTILNWYEDDNDRVTCWLEDCVIHFERTVEEISLTLKEMFDTFKADEVIEYCVERGLNCLPQ